MVPNGQYAFQVFHPGCPMLRMRYRHGVVIGPHGFPDWLRYARAVVDLPPGPPDLGVDEARVTDVLTANAVMARSGDPLWQEAAGTPHGWTWAFLARPPAAEPDRPPRARGRTVALVPVELFGAFRHLGGVSTGTADPGRRGLDIEDGPAPPVRWRQRLSEAAVATVEEHLGYRLPEEYRSFLARTNGGFPAWPAVHPGYGFVVDQPFFGLSRSDWMQDLVYANTWFGDRLTADWLAVGYVQGGLLAIRVRGEDAGSVWYWDDDDRRHTDELSAAEVCQRLLHRCADDLAAFWLALRRPPEELQELAVNNAAGGNAAIRTPERAGAWLPASRRGAVTVTEDRG